MDFSLLSILQIGTGVFWSVVYLLIIKQSWQDKSTGMPMAALTANVAWEFVFTFIYPHQGQQGIIDLIWLTLDLVIFIQYIMYGQKDFPKNISLKLFLPTLLFSLLLSLAIIIASVYEFNDLPGKYAAFGSNLMMSGLFISLLVNRGNSKGQSMGIAFSKMAGSFMAALAFYIYLRSTLITILSIGILLLDLVYIILLYKVIECERQEHFNAE